MICALFSYIKKKDFLNFYAVHITLNIEIHKSDQDIDEKEIYMNNQKLTTLCYIEKDNQYLMLHRVKKENDVNKEKWIGIGGHFEDKESPEECLLREVKEETQLELLEYQHRGIVTFCGDNLETEYMFLYTATKYRGTIKECDEGILEWIHKDALSELNLWEGDRIFFDLIAENHQFFSLKLEYDLNGKLKDAFLDGKKIK